MALLPPVATAPQRPFGSSILADYPYYHIGTETAMFGWYSGSSYQAHFHAGLDFPAPENTPIVAPEAGLVKYAGYAASGSTFDGGGNIVHIFIAGGMHVVSCHLNGMPIVRSGQTVARGQRIGYVGHTGNAFGNHDHFACFTATASGASLFRNPAHFLPGGKYANSALILPPHIPDTAVEAHPVWFNKLKPATGTIHFRVGTHVYSDPGKLVLTVASPSSAPRVASLLNTDGTRYAAYILGTGGVRLVKLSEVSIT
jgi:hypothetical protein